MIAQEKEQPKVNQILTLTILWLVGAVSDRLWFAFDKSVPAWDQADYLTGSLTYWRAFQNVQLFSGEWWQHFWELSPKVPPLTYILTVPFQVIFGRGADQATLVHLFFSAILLASVYSLGSKLFNQKVKEQLAASFLELKQNYTNTLWKALATELNECLEKVMVVIKPQQEELENKIKLAVSIDETITSNKVEINNILQELAELS